MVDPYLTAFFVLLLLYGAYSEWMHLDSRYPIAAGLVLLVATGLASAAGAYATATTLAVYAFFLLVAGVVLLIIDEGRERWGGSLARAGGAKPTAESRQPTNEGDRPSKDSLDSLE